MRIYFVHKRPRPAPAHKAGENILEPHVREAGVNDGGSQFVERIAIERCDLLREPLAIHEADLREDRSCGALLDCSHRKVVLPFLQPCSESRCIRGIVASGQLSEWVTDSGRPRRGTGLS